MFLTITQLLVVLEKHGRFKGTGIWKIPTGMVEEVCILSEVSCEIEPKRFNQYIAFESPGRGYLLRCNKRSKRGNWSKQLLNGHKLIHSVSFSALGHCV